MSERTVQRILYYVGILMAFLMLLGPVMYMTVTAVGRSADFLSPASQFQFTLEHLTVVATDSSLHFMAYLRNSLIVSGAAAVICVVVASMAAYAVTRLRLPGGMLVLFAVLAVSMFPQISLVGYLFRLISRLGWINTYPGLVLPYTAWITPLSLWILVSYFAQIPRDLDRAARVDGCGNFQILIRVIAPVAAPGVFSTLLLAFIFAFNEFMFALMLTTDFHARTVPVGIALFQGLHGEIPWGTIMAASVVTTGPIIILTLIFQRWIVQGITRGAVKG